MIDNVCLCSAQENGKIGSRACNLSIKFPITHDMAPSSKLIVYYVRGNAEVVADTIQFTVQPEFKNKVNIWTKQRSK